MEDNLYMGNEKASITLLQYDMNHVSKYPRPQEKQLLEIHSTSIYYLNILSPSNCSILTGEEYTMKTKQDSPGSKLYTKMQKLSCSSTIILAMKFGYNIKLNRVTYLLNCFLFIIIIKKLTCIIL